MGPHEFIKKIDEKHAVKSVPTEAEARAAIRAYVDSLDARATHDRMTLPAAGTSALAAHDEKGNALHAQVRATNDRLYRCLTARHQAGEQMLTLSRETGDAEATVPDRREELLEASSFGRDLLAAEDGRKQGEEYKRKELAARGFKDSSTDSNTNAAWAESARAAVKEHQANLRGKFRNNFTPGSPAESENLCQRHRWQWQ